MRHFILSLNISLILLSFNFSLISQIQNDSTKVYGVTIDAVDHLSDIVTSLSKLSKKPTVRIVYDRNAPASQYKKSNSQIHNVGFVMGCIADSYYMKNYSVNEYIERIYDYTSTLGDDIDIWEFGNEVNGDWLGDRDTVIAKISHAYSILKGMNKKIALTLYYNDYCIEDTNYQMFKWVNDYLPDSLKPGIDYILVSYYEDDCNNFQPDWQRVFDSLHVIFPNSKLGIGECGTKYKARKESYMKRYYKMNITTPGYIGGYFWWYYKKDCVPYTKPLWNVLNGILNGDDINKN